MLLGQSFTLPIGAVVRQFRRSQSNSASIRAPHAYARSPLSLALVSAILGYPVLLGYMATDLTYMSSRTDAVALALQCATVSILLALSGFTLSSAVATWRLERLWTRKLGLAAVLAALGAIWWVAIVFNLINFNLNY